MSITPIYKTFGAGAGANPGSETGADGGPHGLQITPAASLYAELHCLSNFSFQRGASQPQELVARAHALGYSALAITDECSVAGVVRAHAEAKKLGLKLLLGAEFVVEGFKVIALARNLNGWGNLCEFITAARRAAPKGLYQVSWRGSDWASLAGCEVLLVPPREGQSGDQNAINFEAVCAFCMGFKGLFDSQIWLVLELLHGLDDALWQHSLTQLS